MCIRMVSTGGGVVATLNSCFLLHMLAAEERSMDLVSVSITLVCDISAIATFPRETKLGSDYCCIS